MGQFFWKYRGMAEHWQSKHPSIEKPPELVEALKLHPKELAGLKTFATSKGRGGQARKRAREDATAEAGAPERRADQIAAIEKTLASAPPRN